MKASIKFRDDDRPLMRAKVPIGVLGLPFQSGLSAGGDPRELRFDLSTAFASGPALRLSYRPNDTSLPFALSVRAGLGALGSPARAPFSLAAEFNLLSASFGSPAFLLLLKPRLGDFSLSHTLRSSPPPRKVGEVSDGDGDGHEHELSYKAFSFIGNGLAADVAAAGRSGGVGALLSGMRLTTRSVLPLWGRASLRFNWGLRAPPELQAALADDRNDARVPISKMPLLVMNKISIEQSPRADADKKGGKTETSVPVIAAADASDGAGHGGGEGFSLVRWQLEVLNAESGMLRRAVEDLRAEIGSGRAASMAAGGEARRAPTPPQQPHNAFPVKPDRRGSGKELAAEHAVKTPSDEVGRRRRWDTGAATMAAGAKAAAETPRRSWRWSTRLRASSRVSPAMASPSSRTFGDSVAVDATATARRRRRWDTGRDLGREAEGDGEEEGSERREKGEESVVEAMGEFVEASLRE